MKEKECCLYFCISFLRVFDNQFTATVVCEWSLFAPAFEQLKYAEALVVSKQGKDLSACVATLCR